jgi:hypothetical protein
MWYLIIFAESNLNEAGRGFQWMQNVRSAYSHSVLPCMKNENYESTSTGHYTWKGRSVGDGGFEKDLFAVIIIMWMVEPAIRHSLGLLTDFLILRNLCWCWCWGWLHHTCPPLILKGVGDGRCGRRRRRKSSRVTDRTRKVKIPRAESRSFYFWLYLDLVPCTIHLQGSVLYL